MNMKIETMKVFMFYPFMRRAEKKHFPDKRLLVICINRTKLFV